MNQKTYIWLGGITVGLFVILIMVWFFFLRSTTTPTPTPVTDLFGTSVNNSTNITSTSGSTDTNGSQPVASSGTISAQKVFEITAGPIAGATLIQTLHPTTTLARYINQNDGHVYDLPLDVSGAVPRLVSNVTIPGAARALWLEGGNATILQYTDSTVVKSVYLGLPVATTSTKIVPTRIQFLPDNLVDVAASPDGLSIAYLLKTSSGSDGYVAKSDGTGAKKLFSLPLSQILLTWPSQGTILVGTKSAAGTPGILFSIDTKTAVVTPLLYSQGLTAIADRSFSTIIYQADTEDTLFTYSHNVKTGTDVELTFNPLPEKCIFSAIATSTMYCASPSQSPANYFDLWHQGSASMADKIVRFDTNSGRFNLPGLPGSVRDGGVASDILEMALSPDEHYLSFTTKGQRALWGVRLGN